MNRIHKDLTIIEMGAPPPTANQPVKVLRRGNTWLPSFGLQDNYANFSPSLHYHVTMRSGSSEQDQQPHRSEFNQLLPDTGHHRRGRI
jgi:hypothetical protein